jgi:signal transduction histidine kinase
MSAELAASTELDLRQTAERMSRPDGLSLVVELAHDLRSPLTSILALSESLAGEAGGPVTPVQREQLRLIYTAALHLCNTATDVLELARGTARADDAHREFSVRALLDQVGDIVRPMCEARRVVWRSVGPEHDRRVGSAGTLARVLLNLATNAVKATRDGVVTVEAREAAYDGSRVVWSVSDTGPGLSEEAQRGLYRVLTCDTPRRAPRLDSAGLGLAICRKLVASLDATLHFDTEPRRGTRFHFEIELPRATR